MIECEFIKDKLSAYLEGLVTMDEKKIVEDHLASCGQCRKSADDLKKLGQLLHGLEKIEPPPWFTQKVMKKVREETPEKKGFIRRLFYPFHIKVPAEILATFLVAILVLYTYKMSGPERPRVHPPGEMSAKVVDKASKGADEKMEKMKVEGEALRREVKKKDNDNTTALYRSAQKGDEAGGVGRWKEPALQADTSGTAGEYRPGDNTPFPAAPPSRPADVAPRESFQEALGLKKAQQEMKSKEETHLETTAPAPLFQVQPLTIMIYAKDTVSAIRAVEGLLIRFQARDMVRAPGDKIVYTARVPAASMEALFDALKPLGEVRKKEASTGPAAKNRQEEVRLEITPLH